ncbi:MAG: hypothetical protein LBV71_19140 [Prevotella sp.]|jgi:hypothetical protein|nr:hypothetical protein [Prevotella sp.]
MEDNKNIFGKKRSFCDGIPDYHQLSIVELEEKLSNNSGYIKSQVLIELANRNQFDYLHRAIINKEYQQLKALSIFNVAQIAGLAIIDYGTKADIIKLRNELKTWSEYQIETFDNYLKKSGVNIFEFE